MADRFWVGGGSSPNWNATGNTNWSATSGGANNASVPTTGDTVIFDSNSGSGTSVMNLSVSLVKCDLQGYAGTLTHNGGITITITGAAADSLRLPNTGTYTAAATSSLFTLTSTSGTTDITSNGKRFGGLTLNGAGGTFRLLDALRVDAVTGSTLTLTTGTFNANNFNVTAGIFVSSNSNTRTITMGSGTWTVGGSVGAATNFWQLSTITNLTFNKDTANIVVPSNGLASWRGFQGGNLTYNNLTVDSNTGLGAFTFNGGNSSFAALSIGAGNQLGFSNGSSITASSISMTGTSALPCAVLCAALGGAATLTISGGSVAFEWGAFRDMTFAGATFTATNSLNLGNNSGISISAPSISSAPTAGEIADAVWDEARAEPGQGVPSASASMASKLGYLYKAWRNRHTQTDAEYALYADDGVTKDQEAVVSDNGTTFERGEMDTGA